MIYADAHCDTLTACSDEDDFFSGDLQASVKKLIGGGCAAQCFAVFTDGENAAAEAEKYFRRYESAIAKYGGLLQPILCGSDFETARRDKKLGCILTVENLGFLKSPEDIPALHDRGVRMASLVWNNANAYASPNLVMRGGLPSFGERCGKGLTEQGKEAVHMLDSSGIIVDISHLSDGGADEILAGRKIPLVASHSNCAAVKNVSRNLTDGQIRAVADCGGAVCVNFCADFTGRRLPEGTVGHIAHIIRTAGEDAPAIGGDFDGMPATEGMEDCLKVRRLLELLSEKFPPRVTEKIAYSNFMRVFRDVAG